MIRGVREPKFDCIFFFTPDLIFLKEQNQSGGIRNAYKNLVGKHEGNRPFLRPMCRCEELLDEEMIKSLVQANRNCENLKIEIILIISKTINFSKKPLHHGVIEIFALVSWLFHSERS
jgi:hypothetical protein